MNSKIIMIFLTILTLNSLYGHPHIFIDYKLEIIENSKAHISWTFDPLESEKNIYYFDNNNDGELDSNEEEILYNEGFSRIKEYNYFIILRINNQEIIIDNIQNFQADIEENGQLTYKFDIELPELQNRDKLSIAHFDTTYFVSFSEPSKESIILNNSLYSMIIKNLSKPYYYDPGAGRNVVLDTSKPKPGWVKAYPTEIFISREPILMSFGEYKVTLREKLIQLQRIIYLKLSGYLIDIKSGQNTTSIIVILLLGFLYGIIHALGPGHRKVVISSYLLSHHAGKIKAVGLSLISALMHSSSGIIIVLVLNSIFLKIKDEVIQDVSTSLESTGYYSLLLLSVIIIFIKIFKRKKRDGNVDKLGISMIILASLLPCPGAITIMLFSLSMKMPIVGIATVIAMSLGIGFSLSGISILTIKGKELLNRLPEKKFLIAQNVTEWTGLGLLILFALFMIIFQR